jgi:hypothetical protein
MIAAMPRLKISLRSIRIVTPPIVVDAPAKLRLLAAKSKPTDNR